MRKRGLGRLCGIWGRGRNLVWFAGQVVSFLQNKRGCTGFLRGSFCHKHPLWFCEIGKSGKETDCGLGHNEIEVMGSFKIEHPTGSCKCDIKALERGLKWRYRFETHQYMKMMKAHSANPQERERAREVEERDWRSHEIRTGKDLWWFCIFSPFAPPHSDFAAFGDPCACVGSLGDLRRQEVSSLWEHSGVLWSKLYNSTLGVTETMVTPWFMVSSTLFFPSLVLSHSDAPRFESANHQWPQ